MKQTLFLRSENQIHGEKWYTKSTPLRIWRPDQIAHVWTWPRHPKCTLKSNAAHSLHRDNLHLLVTCSCMAASGSEGSGAVWQIFPSRLRIGFSELESLQWLSICLKNVVSWLPPLGLRKGLALLMDDLRTETYKGVKLNNFRNLIPFFI